ncbi:MAG: efflux RND transporter periplasmic adaptor subunit [Desulfovibrionaceae bacterium]|nr:efflux RND transporter periplasmic adaptor subunit [Desulfovibrionaceae bacterium]
MRKFLVLLVVLALLGVGGYYYLNPPSETKLILYGNVDQRQVSLAFQDADRIAQVLAEEGDIVEKGQVLARLETRRLRDSLAVLEARVAEANANLERLENGTRPEEISQAKAQVASAKADLDYAEKQLRRVSSISLHSQGKGVRQSELDLALARRDAALAKLVVEKNRLALAEIGPRSEDLAEARAILLEREMSFKQAQNQLQDRELKSPSKAVVNRRLLEVGDMASPERSVFSLAILSPKWVRAYVSETQLGLIKPGQKALVFTDSFKEAFPGRVGFISKVAEFTPKNVETEELRTSLVYEVRIYVQDQDDRLRLGMPATVTF